MLTTCPECRTTFRVTQEHLGLRRGLVRCGHCGVVFNAYDSLLAELVAPPNEPDKFEETTTVFAATETESEVPKLVVEPPVQDAEQAPTEALPSEPPEPPPVFVAVDSPREDRTPAAPGEETSESILLSELPTRIKRATPVGRLQFFLKFLVALLLGGLLLLQLALYLRGELAAAMPSARPLLQTLCQPFGCVVRLPRQLDKTAIVASSLEHDAENRSRARLVLLLANRTGQAQTWPHIVLILTDVRDAPVAQRVFSPTDYLAKDAHPETGMAAGEELEIRLDLDTSTLAATGYALDLAHR